MKKLNITIVLLLVATLTFAQKSPRKQVNGKVGEVTIDIDYGAPSVRDRVIWGDLVPYNKVWRAGANENTTMKFDKDVTINGAPLPAGKYGFFMIPTESGEWEVIFSKKNDAWGSNGYDANNDQLRVKLSVNFVDDSEEVMTFSIKEDTGIEFAWAKARLLIPVK
jgi:hypothetical protein